MKKKIFLPILLLAASLTASAQETTNDRLYITGEEMLAGGSEARLSMALSGTDKLYTGYQMDITFPEGIEYSNSEGKPAIEIDQSGIYPKKNIEGKISQSHSLDYSCEVIAPRTIRIICTSTTNEPFAMHSGSLFHFKAKAAERTEPSFVNLALSNCKFATYNPETKEVKGYTFTQNQVEGMYVTTGISTPKADKSEGKTYDLSGKNISSPKEKRPYIKNGKKYIYRETK